MDTQPTGLVTVPSVDVTHYFNIVINFFTSHGWDFWHLAQNVVGLIVGLSMVITVFFFFMIFITVEGLKKVRKKEEELFLTPPAVEEVKVEKVDEEQSRRWKKVMEHMGSQNPSDWRQAIMEADIMLDQLLNRLGYRGEGIGEKLKRTTKGDFKSQQAAWEAHLVRNRIAHDGSDYDLNEIEARRVINLYRQVFDEFYHIAE